MFRSLILLTLLMSIVSCRNKADRGFAKFTTSRISPTGDTINITNENGKQGHWIVFDTDLECCMANTLTPPVKQESQHDKSLTAQNPLEEGFYKNGQKQGIWKYYHSDGSIKKTVLYKDDVAVEK